MDRLHANSNNVALLIVLLLAILFLRLWLLDYLPLYDTTEARYAEIARIMHETDNWVTPQFDYQVPFWGKPPLHTWMSASSFSILGISAFTARLPHYLCGILILVVLYQFSRRNIGKDAAMVAVLVMASSFGFIAAMGMVMTDVALVFAITLAMISYWQAYSRGEKTVFGHLFFISLGLGMLVKGPVAIVLVGIALSFWLLTSNRARAAITCLPWLTGLPLFLLVSLPWYALAEYKTPGFLQYFIVGEHFQRFIVSGWEGDLYGNAHEKMKGTIWIYWLLAAFPWTFLAIKPSAGVLSTFFQNHKTRKHHSELSHYLFGWMIAPMLLFTFASNILIAYVLPGFAAMSLLIAIHFSFTKKLIGIASVTLVLLSAIPLAKHLNMVADNTDSYLLGSDTLKYENYPLYYWLKRPFSGRFYSNGQAQLITSSEQLVEVATTTKGAYIATKIDAFDDIFPKLQNLCDETNRSSQRVLLFCKGKE